MTGKLYCGTSGFSYPTWKPAFYPAKLPAAKFLSHYATRLNAVEINYTFRALPSASTLSKWIEATPPNFLFAPKCHQRITHIDRLATTTFTEAFFQSIDPLRVQQRLGPILIQTPPNLALDLPKLQAFLNAAPTDIPLAFEFRNKTWFTEDVYEALRARNACLCLAESEKLETPPVLTANFVYFRLRKPDYTPEDRAEIAAKANSLRDTGKDVYLFFKHEDTPDGALHAEAILNAAT